MTTDTTAPDTARLDWLQSQWADGVYVEVCAAGGPTWHQLAPEVSVFLGSRTFKAETVREAIDAAMKDAQ